MFKGSTIIGQLGEGSQDLLIESRLLARQHIDVSMLEIPQELTLDPALPFGQPTFRDVHIIVGQSLQSARLD